MYVSTGYVDSCMKSVLSVFLPPMSIRVLYLCNDCKGEPMGRPRASTLFSHTWLFLY